MKKNKRGFLLAEETLKIILAIIAIGFLVFLLFSLYNAGKDSRALGLAKESLDFLVEEISNQRGEVDVYNPEGWIISSWSLGQLPLSCSNIGWDNCICICKKATPDKCDSKGVCLENPQKFEIESPIKIENPPITLSIDYKTTIISGE